MRPIILLTILAVLPISCRFYLNRQPVITAEALVELKKISETMKLAGKTHDVDLYLSLFDKSLKIERCGQIVTYADLERNRREHPGGKIEEMDLVSAFIEGNYLKCEFSGKGAPAKKYLFTAVKNGADFKIIKVIIEGGNCPSRRRLLQEDIGEYIF